MRDGILKTVLLALLLAVVVGFVFSVVEAVDEYAGVAGVVTFLGVLLAGLLGDRRTGV